MTDDLYRIFEGKTLKENLQDIIARNNTGYSYNELERAIAAGDDGLDDDELLEVDSTVNLLAHLFRYEQKKGVK